MCWPQDDGEDVVVDGRTISRRGTATATATDTETETETEIDKLRSGWSRAYINVCRFVSVSCGLGQAISNFGGIYRGIQ